MSEPFFPIVIRLAGEPRGKGRPIMGRVKTKSGQEFLTARTPERTRSYESSLRFAASNAMGGRVPVEGALFVTMTATFPVPASASKKLRAAMLAQEVYPTKKPDVDNILKCSDALNQIVWVDDKQIAAATILKIYGEAPGLKIVVKLAKRLST